MANSISLKTIEKIKKKCESDNHVKVVRNAMIRTDLSDLTMNWDRYRNINHSFSNVVKGEMPVTNQKSSGRCWGFAGLNLFRFYIGRKHNLKNFEFSQSYFMFWDKLEKANYFLECIIDSASEDWNSRMVMHRLSNPIEDGGQWDMWVSLIDKYGVIVPNREPNGVAGLIEKPNVDSAPSNLASIGRYVLTPDIFNILKNQLPGAGGEIQLADAINTQAEGGLVESIILDGERFDCGSVEGYLDAIIKVSGRG